jgi:hypothetical protein
MGSVKCRRVETAVRFDRPAILAEFLDIFSHDILPDLLSTEAYPLRAATSRTAGAISSRTRLRFSRENPAVVVSRGQIR